MMSPTLLMVCASLLFATMGVCIKFASVQYSPSEIVMYRGLVGMVLMAVWAGLGTNSLRTPVPAMHFWRSASGVTALTLWFYAIAGLPLGTAITLNYMSSVWMALFLMGGAVLMGAPKTDGRLVATVLVGFVGVALVLRLTLSDNAVGAGLAGLASGMLAAMAYLQVTALGRAGEPEGRIVFYFSLGSVVVGLAVTLAVSSLHAHTWRGAGLLLATGLLGTTAQWCMTRAYALGRPLSNASLQYLGIVFSVGYGYWLIDDAITPSGVAGMALIIAAGVAASVLNSRRPAGTTPPVAPIVET
jgi:drug/metabolite transporter (DMT)-like permease